MVAARARKTDGTTMILYQLHCVNDHTFEAWFRSSASYDEQVAAGDVECPFCGETHVAKAPMAPHIVKAGRLTKAERIAKGDLADLETAPAQADQTDERRAQDLARQILKAVDKLREHVEENFEFVGDDFADEARKIQSGDAEERGIYGNATDDEARRLDEEGVEYFRIPTPVRRNG